MKEDKFLKGQLEDRIQTAANQYIVTCSPFLDGHGQAIAMSLVKEGTGQGISPVFYGGYDDAERRVLLCLPDYAKLQDYNPLSVIRVSVKPGGKPLGHGDYLGSVLGLGLSRDKVGDILVRDDGADIIILDEIKDFMMTNYVKAGRAYLSLESVPIDQLIVPERKPVIKSDTVASLRLDNIVASAFAISRTKAAEAIKSGRVLVDCMEELRPDVQVQEGSKIVLRGKGRVYFIEIGGRSRKDRQYITFEKYQ